MTHFASHVAFAGNCAELRALQDVLEVAMDDADENLSAQALRKIGDFTRKIGDQISRLETSLMTNGDAIHDGPGMKLMEHPKHGDEAPLMAFCKVSQRFWEETPFWDADDIEEIREWMMKQ